MSTHRAQDHHHIDRTAGPTHEAFHWIRVSTSPGQRVSLFAVALGLALIGSMLAGVTVRAQSPGGATETEPGLCFEATSSVLVPESWAEVLQQITTATEQDSAFFPDAAIVTMPDLDHTWDPAAFPTIRIGIWGTGASELGSSEQLRDQLAHADCLREGSEWTTVVSHDLVLAAAESILADARLPQDGAEQLVSDDVEADIDVTFHPAEQRIRTNLEWSKPVFGPVNVGGQCWIDDVLAADAGQVIVISGAGSDVSLGGEAGCALFQEFLDEQGAGQRASHLLPKEFSLADGSTVDVAVQSVDVRDSEIVLAGALVRS
jgi:hypothetical protein